MTDPNTAVVRRLARVAALTVALFAAMGVSPALAAPPQQWEQPEPVSTLYVLFVLVGAPLALFAVITALVYMLPSSARGESYTPGLAWRNENEWFGGPHGGVDAVDSSGREAVESSKSAEAEDPRGGASARW